VKPHTALKYIAPDEVAECWEGVDDELYAALWGCVNKYKKIEFEDVGPHDVIGINSVSKFWRYFSMHEKRQLNNLAARQMKKVEDSL
jgi:hypothetical protein